MIQAEKSLVAKIELAGAGGTDYYVSDRYGITLDGVTYSNIVTAWGRASYEGNIGDGFRIGNFSITMVNGEEMVDNGVLLDPTIPWNNQSVTVKKWTSGITTFAGCDNFVKGIIKNFNMTASSISFDVEMSNNNDDILLPSIVCEDQSGLTAEADYRTAIFGSGGLGISQVRVTDPTLFDDNEFVKIYNADGGYEYNQIDNISNDLLTLKNDLINSYTNSGTYVGCYVEKPFRSLPEESIGKTIPIQVGDLSDSSDGVFGKAVAINNLVGNQSIMVDSINSNSFDGVGVWDNGLKRFFIGLKERTRVTSFSQDTVIGQKIFEVENPGIFYFGMTVKIEDDLSSEINVVDAVSVQGGLGGTPAYNISVVDTMANAYTTGNNAKLTYYAGEYEINADNKNVFFRIDSKAILQSDIYLTADIDTLQLGTGEAKYISWINEDSHNAAYDEAPEILSPSIIMMGQELMLVLEEPDTATDTIVVERGYNGTTKTDHFANDLIYQSAQFSSKNMITFKERFDPTVIANNYLGSSGAGTPSYTTPSQYIFQSGNTGKLSNMLGIDTSTFFRYIQQFSRGLTPGYAWYALDLKFQKIEESLTLIGIYPAVKFSAITSGGFSYTGSNNVLVNIVLGAGSGTYNTDPDTIGQSASIYYDTQQSPGALKSIDSFDDYESDSNKGGVELLTALGFSSLTDLNRRIKIYLILACNNNSDPAQVINSSMSVYNVSFWCEFIRDFTIDRTFAPLQGRLITADTDTITGATAGDLMQGPVEVLAQFLTQEAEYSTSDFNTTNWTAVRTYYETAGKFSSGVVPRCAMSYGYDDDRERVWDFCSKIASHFNLALIKDYDGIIDIINLHEIYYDTPSGSEIHIDDILFLPQNGNRRLTVKQTGTDLLYNDINVKWKRNNSSGEYQQVYKIPDDYSVTLSGNPLRSIRETYYGGKRRGTEVESPFIYNEDDAIRKAKWEMDDKSEAHFWIEFFIDFDHYSESQSPPLSTQYHIGDIIYLVGTSHGVNFESGRKFYIQNVFFSDSGREIEIHAKSLENIMAFETTATTGEKVIFDTGGTSLTGDDIWNDTGGTGVTGDDIINDTGGIA